MLFHCIFGSDSLWWWAHSSWTGSVFCSTGLYSHRETIVFHWRNLLMDSTLNWANSPGTSALLSPAQHRFDSLMDALENSSCCAKWKVNFQFFFISIFVCSPQLQRLVSVFFFKLYLLTSFFFFFNWSECHFSCCNKCICAADLEFLLSSDMPIVQWNKCLSSQCSCVEYVGGKEIVLAKCQHGGTFVHRVWTRWAET